MPKETKKKWKGERKKNPCFIYRSFLVPKKLSSCYSPLYRLNQKKKSNGKHDQDNIIKFETRHNVLEEKDCPCLGASFNM